MTNYYIKRGKTYFAKNISINQNHWVLDRKEAKRYTTKSQARQVIRQYKLKNCEVEDEKSC